MNQLKTVEKKGLFLLCLVLPFLAAASPASEPSTRESTSSLVNRLLRSTSDASIRVALREPGRRAEALKLLSAAFHDPANAKPDTGGFIRDSNGRDDILTAAVDVLDVDAIDLVIEGAHDQDPWVRCVALRALGQSLHSIDPTLQKMLRDGLKDGDPYVVEAALRGIQNRGDTEAGPAVLELLRHPIAFPDRFGPTTYNAGVYAGHTSNRGFEIALRAIGATRYGAALPDLLKLAANPSAYVRADASQAMALCAENADAPTREQVHRVLKQMLSDPNAGVNAQAALAIAEFKDPAAIPILVFHLRIAVQIQDINDHNDSRLTALEAIRAIEKITGEDFGSSLGDKVWVTQFSVANDEELKRGLEALQPRVKAILDRLAKLGMSLDGYPQLPQKLDAGDRAMLDRGFSNWLIDPTGAQWGTINTTEHDVWGETKNVQMTVWMFPAVDQHPARAVEDDGTQVRFESFEKKDLVAETQAKISTFLAGHDVWLNLETAAWLSKLGKEEMAAQVLYICRGDGDRADISLDHPGASGAWDAFSSAVNAYIVFADDDALAQAERLQKLYAGYLDTFGPGTRLLEELQRRKKEGGWNAKPEALPKDFDSWPTGKRVERLIHDLQDIAEKQQGQPGGVNLTADERVQKLIAIGEPAVPALIDCIESDKRLTRSVHFWRDFAQDRDIIAVREAALTAVMSILRTSFFQPASTGDDFSARNKEKVDETVRELRAYWGKYGKLPFDERMMKILIEPETAPAAALEAAENLSTLGAKSYIGTMVWTSGGGTRPKGANPAIAKFKNPTVAEAILAAHDRAIATLDKPDDAYQRDRTESAFADALIALGDPAITPNLAKRYAAATDDNSRRRWAFVCFCLHEETPLKETAGAFKSGKLKLPEFDPKAPRLEESPAAEFLEAYLHDFVQANTAYCDEALFALAQPDHPYHAVVAAVLQQLAAGTDDYRGYVWFEHRFSMAFLRSMLDDDKTPLSQPYTLKGETQQWFTKDGKELDVLPAALEAVPANERLESAPGLLRDAAAMRLADRVIGAPAYHPLIKDAAMRLKDIKAFLDRFARLRILTDDEYASMDLNKLESRFNGPRFVPDFDLLDHPATPADVAAGHALFELGGKGKLLAIKLPATARLKDDPHQADAPRVLIMQAESDSDGKSHYTVIGAHLLKELTGDQLEDIKPVEKPNPEEPKK